MRVWENFPIKFGQNFVIPDTNAESKRKKIENKK